MNQDALTLFVPFEQNRFDSLKEMLETIGGDIKDNPILRFSDSPSTHFARWVIISDVDRGPRLMFAPTFDGTRDEYVAELARTVGPGMDRVLSHCTGYQPGTAQDPRRLKEFFERFLVKHHTFVRTFPGLTVGEIRRNAQVRARLEAELTAKQRDAATIFRVPAMPTVAAATKLSPPNPERALSVAKDRLANWLLGIKPGAENANVHVKTRGLTTMEDRVVQNQMTTLSKNKPSFFSRFLLRTVLFFANHPMQSSIKDGVLQGLTQIHFARWSIVDGGDNLLFESNYDGSWESYIDGFIDNNSSGMNLIWGNGVGFPLGGCKDNESFKKVIRDHQHTAQVYYSAYPDLTVRNIFNDLQVSQALQKAPGTSGPELFASGFYPSPGSGARR